MKNMKVVKENPGAPVVRPALCFNRDEQDIQDKNTGFTTEHTEDTEEKPESAYLCGESA